MFIVYENQILNLNFIDEVQAIRDLKYVGLLHMPAMLFILNFTVSFYQVC